MAVLLLAHRSAVARLSHHGCRCTALCHARRARALLLFPLLQAGLPGRLQQLQGAHIKLQRGLAEARLAGARHGLQAGRAAKHGRGCACACCCCCWAGRGCICIRVHLAARPPAQLPPHRPAQRLHVCGVWGGPAAAGVCCSAYRIRAPGCLLRRLHALRDWVAGRQAGRQQLQHAGLASAAGSACWRLQLGAHAGRRELLPHAQYQALCNARGKECR